MSRFGLHVIVLTALTLVSSCLRTGTAQELTTLENEFCNLRSTIIAIDQPSYRHFPYYVTLYRCGGSDGFTSPRYRTCVPATIKDVRIKVKNLETGEFTEIIEKNHTSCKPGCANKKAMCDTEMEAWNEQACRCECRYPNGPPQACPARFKWNKYMCACECDTKEEHASQCLDEGKVWSHDKCGCECSPRVISRCKKLNKVLDEQTCRCVLGEVVFGANTGTEQEKGISKTLLVGIVFGELLLLLFIFDIILYMKDWGFMHYIKKSVGKAVGKVVSQDSHESPPLSPTANHDTSAANHDTSTYV